jgi:hypothetical protein
MIIKYKNKGCVFQNYSMYAEASYAPRGFMSLGGKEVPTGRYILEINNCFIYAVLPSKEICDRIIGDILSCPPDYIFEIPSTEKEQP